MQILMASYIKRKFYDFVNYGRKKKFIPVFYCDNEFKVPIKYFIGTLNELNVITETLLLLPIILFF